MEHGRAASGVKHKAQYPELAASYARIAQEDLNHADLLHRSVVEMIENKKRQGAEVPEAMQAIWDYEHEKQIEDAADVRRLLDMYKA